MYCPICKAEYRPGFKNCATCSISLVDKLPAEKEPDYITFVTVYEAGDPAFISFAKSILDAEGIKYFFKGEGLQDLFAGGRIGTGFNPLVGPVQIQVDENYAEHAKQILQELKTSQCNDFDCGFDENDYDEIIEKPHHSKSKIDIFSLLLGLLTGALLAGVITLLYVWNQKQLTNTVEYDFNMDSKPDTFYSYEKGIIVKTEHDRNFDGEIDDWVFFVQGAIDHSESDNDFDGLIDTWGAYKNGNVAQIDVDTNNDDEPDIIEYYKHGIFVEQEWFIASRKIIHKRAFFRLGIKHEELIDENLDGKFDKKITYNSSERPVSVQKLR